MFRLVDVTTGEVMVDLAARDDAPVAIGRDSACDVVIASHLASRRHAELRKHDGAWHIQDLGSRNGTSFNGALLLPQQPQLLKHGDVITIATWQARVVASDNTLTAVRIPLANAPAPPVRALWLDEAGREVWVTGTLLHPPLSEQQFALLRVLFDAQGGWVAREACVRAVWPDAKAGVSGEALDGVIKRLRARLREVDGAPEFIEQRRGVGLRLVQVH
jgi:DNA-binding response OmpR family regulator